ncbi:MAG: YciI family protein [Fusobacteriaceae bacterium]|jgi:uncharacterized protein YciI|nr:YciI family protein [Fusobacteriaceae bacterium]
MIILILTYQKPISEVDKYLEVHRNYLDECYAKGRYILSGPQNPRTGGVIFVKGTREEASEWLKEDPFYQHEIAKYDIIEFNPNKFAPNVEKILL